MGRRLTDGEIDIIREQERDARPSLASAEADDLERAITAVEQQRERLIGALADIHAAAATAVCVEPDPARRDVLAGIVRVADAAIREARGV